MSYEFLKTPIEYLKGVGPKRAALLRSELNISTFDDLLNYFPFRYVDRSTFSNINEIDNDQTYFQLKGKILQPQIVGAARAKRLTAYLKDDTGIIELVWFQGINWALEKIKADVEYIVFGKPNYFNGKFNLSHPEIEPVEDFDILSSQLRPFYPSTEKLKSKNLNSRGIAKLTKLLISQIETLPETLSPQVINRFKFVSRHTAVINIHYPENKELLNKATTRLKFEELFFIQLALLRYKYVRTIRLKGHVFKLVGDNFNTFYKRYLPFELTNAQKRVIKEIRADMGSGHQMNRLLQGDVGSGKTLVALMCMFIAIDNGFQASLMAPTEILAQQHFKTISDLLLGMDLKAKLLTGSTRKAERQEIHDGLESGVVNIIIGTHALIEDTVQFKNLGLVIIDEQHRFGVEQRARLWQKNEMPPHVLVMTATPIPRTLAMTVYGDLDYSVINELPPGRKPVQTYHYYDNKRLMLYGFLKRKIAEGQQIYVVYPLIKESENLDLADLMAGYESLSRTFPLPDYAISIVHGQMKTDEKDFEMQRFIKGETQIMVATTVIEVGVDIPNASVMVIENAERFGLSQLHQLRGRVGRGAQQSFCILMTSYKLTADGKKRIDTMVKTTDGFKIAEVDMKLRGPGDMHGTRQSGMLDLRLADIIRDEKMLRYARDLAAEILKSDPDLVKNNNHILKERLSQLKKHQKDWSLIS
ncbi:MAG TPA: ATP-dependent DNA helicase RecG [Bacteroidales bacterium]|jgi:ATP-dependent DNA helicase RecG|nr:ATP-dependent DNA helicase RecG [Bacteroidales bacterium]MBP7873487.1 ATP-dependent DNA helicase RecG [Bacteroidales bacterium]MCZ2281644.1 ATP-dependent DNA helicase RecG [Bacteroidales bacterium]HPX33575.1 ATP-dependent DNA helicase RecG [Bacteroidales bacterium]HQB47865.1 ATP-dependent DNA helicase RecG [Bacteroidales bacterium]